MKAWKKKIQRRKEKNSADAFLRSHIIRRNQRSTVEEKIIRFFVFIALRIAIRPHHWKDKRKNREIISKTYRRITSRDFMFIPPAFAFYLIMAFMPLISITVLINSLIPDTHSFFDQAIKRFINIDISNINNDFSWANLSTRIGGMIITILLSTWIAAGGFAKFIFTESYLYEHQRSGGFWMNRLRGASIVFATALWMTLGMTVFAFGPSILEGMQFKEGTVLFDVLLILGNIGTAFLFIYFGFVMLFKMSPRFKLTWRQVHPGAIIATTPTLLFSVVYIYTSKYLFNYSQFGIIAPMLTLSMIMFTFSYFIYVGLIANAAFYKTHHHKFTINKATLSKK